MHKLISFATALWLTAMICNSRASIAQTDTTSPNTVTASWAWTTERWDASDRPFQKVRDEVWRSISHGQHPEALVGKYKALARTEPYHPPYDLPAQFGWAYAAYQAAVADPKFRNHGEFLPAIQALGYGPSPRSYEYARLRFLMEAMNWPDIHLKIAGERLLRRMPNDFQVKYHLTHVLAAGISPQDRDTAVVYAQQMVRAMPDKANMYSLLGETRFTRWLGNKSKADGDSAVAAYQKYLALAPQNDSFRKQAQFLIKRIRSG